MSHNNPSSSDETPRRFDALDLFLADPDDPAHDAEDAQERGYQRDLQLIRALTGHSDHIASLEQPSAVDQERLSVFQSVIDERHPSDSKRDESVTSHNSTDLAPRSVPSPLEQGLTNGLTIREKLDERTRPRDTSARRLVLQIAAALLIAIGLTVWGLRRTQDATSLAVKPSEQPETHQGPGTVNANSQRSPIPGPVGPVAADQHTLVVDRVRALWTTTESLLQKYLKLNPSDIEEDSQTPQWVAMRNVTGLEIDASQWQSATEDFERTLLALESQPNKTVAELVTLGNWNLYFDLDVLARDHFLDALERSPNLPEAWIGLAIVFENSTSAQGASPLRAELSGWMASRSGNQADAMAKHLDNIRTKLKPWKDQIDAERSSRSPQ